MNSDRNTILSMLAVGRITPREAERLLAVSPEEEDPIVRLALTVALAAVLLPYLGYSVAAVGHALAGLMSPIQRVLGVLSGMA